VRKTTIFCDTCGIPIESLGWVEAKGNRLNPAEKGEKWDFCNLSCMIEYLKGKNKDYFSFEFRQTNHIREQLEGAI
jgi:hypothetical protein